ncbi:glycosyltransferase [Salinibacterium sp. UTAS2018]|uniref:glycosyltransferase n=1 Tax=Salinibacterium sp. UTAS2018 TaxID=2508880 RepID=UPI00100944CB|nr:glycosyltransferase [Salinibacterium sp. UTAS2018]QAV69994.1 glycosyltransferase [Salinibacterium sp. UTAS2018]
MVDHERDFSLLLPIYSGDQSAFLERAFRSCLDDQTLQPAEVVVVQDGPISAELSATMMQLIASSPVPTKLLVLEKNRGLARALDAGLAECSFDVVARMDADDVSLPTRFEKQRAAIAGGFDLVGTAMFEFADDDGSVIGKRIPPQGQEEIARYSRFHDPFNHPTVMYRRSAVAAAGGYIDVGLMEDYWLFARMIDAGARVENLQEALLMYRVSAGAYTRRGGLGQLKAELRLQREFRKLGFTTPLQNVRNVIVRGGYRLVPVAIRRIAYRRFIARGFHS